MKQSSSPEWSFIIIWFYAADVVRSCGIERLHQEMKRLSKLRKEINPNQAENMMIIQSTLFFDTSDLQ